MVVALTTIGEGDGARGKVWSIIGDLHYLCC